MGLTKQIYTGYRGEELEEEYIQDIIFSQEYDREQELLSHYTQPLRQQKRLFSSKFKRNRRNSFRFARLYNTQLPF